MIDALIAIFQSDTFLLLLCFGPIVLAAVLIGLHYVGLWRLTHKPIVDNQQIRRYRIATGRLIFLILLLPVPLIIGQFIINEAIIFPAQLSRVEADANRLVQAIENFHIRTGKYPATLDELMPIELEQVPTLPGGESFGYKSGGDWYSLTYGYTRIAPVTCRYNSGSLGWYCD